MLTVAQLTALLAAAHGRTDAEVRYWLGNMRRDDHLLAGNRPRGRGHPVLADPWDALIVAIAYELASHDLPPKTIGRIVAAMPGDAAASMARVVLGLHDGRCLLAVDGDVGFCAASDLVRWAEGRGSTRSAIVVNLTRILDDLRTAADDRTGTVPEGFAAGLEAWARDVIGRDRNA